MKALIQFFWWFWHFLDLNIEISISIDRLNLKRCLSMNRASSLFSIMKTVHNILTHRALVILSSPICHTNLISIL
jgi:hypothetical protein